MLRNLTKNLRTSKNFRSVTQTPKHEPSIRELSRPDINLDSSRPGLHPQIVSLPQVDRDRLNLDKKKLQLRQMVRSLLRSTAPGSPEVAPDKGTSSKLVVAPNVHTSLVD